MNEFFKITNIPDDIANAKPFEPKKILHSFKAEPEKKLDETKHQADVESNKPHIIFLDEFNICPKAIMEKVVAQSGKLWNELKTELDKAAAEKTRMEEFRACKRVNESLEQGYEGFMNYIKRIRGTVNVCPTIKELADYLKLNGLPPEIADLARVSKTDYVIWLAQKVKGLMK